MRSLLVLVLLAGVAHARPAPRPILPDATCWFEPSVYPYSGAKDVALDTKAWVVGSELKLFDVEYRLRWDKSERIAKVTKHAPFDVIELDLGRLLPNKRYTLIENNQVISTFTTGFRSGGLPPRAPEITRAAATNDLYETSFFEIDFKPDSDRRFVELRIDDRVLFAPTVDGLRLGMGCANVDQSPTFCFEATAIDLAGQRSTPTSHCGTVTRGPGMPVYSDHRYDHDPPVDDTRQYPLRPLLGFGCAFAIGAIIVARARRRRSAKHLA